MFTQLYLETTNPKLKFQEMLKPSILFPMIFSSILHTIMYCVFVNTINFIFTGKMISSLVNKRLFIALLIIMTLGFFGRLYRAKDIYKGYHYDLKKTRKHMDKAYITWCFIS